LRLTPIVNHFAPVDPYAFWDFKFDVVAATKPCMG
jgi:hypothetical protein